MAYLGKTPSQAVRSRFYFTASGGETSLAPAQVTGLSFTDANYVDVSLNGVALVSGTDYTATPSTNTISSLSALTASDVVEIVVYDTFSVFGGNVNGDFTISNGTLTAGTVDINGGAVDGTTIGAASAAAVTGTTITGDSLDINGAANINSGTTDNALTVVSTDSGVNIVLTDNTTSMAVGNSAGTFQLFGDTSSFPKLISASNSAVVINEDSNDTDFRVEGNGDANLLFVDAGNDRVGIGTSSPSQLFDATATGSTTSVILAQNTTSNNGAAHLRAKNPQNELIIGTDNHSGGLTGTANASFLYTSSTTPIVIMPNGSEKVRIDSSGNVGIGCTDGDITSDGNASRTYVTIQGTANRGRLNLGCTASNGADTATLGFTNGANTVASISSDSDSGSQTAGNIQFATAGSVRASIASSGDVIINDNANNAKLLFRDQSNSTGIYLQQIGSSGSPALRFYDTGANSERMRIDSSGSLLINTTSKGGSEQLSLIGGPAFNMAHASTGTIGVFRTSGISGSIVGSISITGSATAYNTSSDHRLKEGVEDMTGAIERVKALAPKRFNFIVNPDTTVDGFLAHEAQAVVPEAVTGTHNEVDADGNAVMQGIDQSKLVPLLTGALREAITKIETLETQRADLEARLTALENAE